MVERQLMESEIYQGQFGEFTITEDDRRGVVIYRSALATAALSFGIGSSLVLGFGNQPFVLTGLTVLYTIFSLALGVALLTIHIYLAPLHRLLQAFWVVGSFSAMAIALQSVEPLALAIYKHPLSLLGMGFTFAALTGIFFKEAFCFDRLETKLLTPLVPVLLLGHLFGILPVTIEQVLLGIWAGLFGIFALRKLTQAIPPDIGDKSVFAYLKQQKVAS